MTLLKLLHKTLIISTLIIFSPIILISNLVLSGFRKTILYLDKIWEE